MNLHIEPVTVRAAVRGDALALRAVVEALQGPLYNLSLRMLGVHEDAEEATQEALLRVITHLGSFRSQSLFSTWAWTIATRVVLEYRRQRGRRPLPIEDFEADLALGRDDRATEVVHDAVLLQQVKLGCGRAMLQCLDDDHRVVYTLGEILEVPGPQAAEALGISAAAYRKRLSRARSNVSANLRRTCGVVESSAPCRCHKRVRPAMALGRLDPRDAEQHLAVATLRRSVAAIEELDRAQAYYRADPMALPPTSLIERVREALGLA